MLDRKTCSVPEAGPFEKEKRCHGQKVKSYMKKEADKTTDIPRQHPMGTVMWPVQGQTLALILWTN